MNDKELEYSTKLTLAVQEAFNEDSEYYISPSDITEGDNMTAFMHALANIVPAAWYKQLTGEKVDMLAFNHIANRLCFQFCDRPDETPDES